MLGPVKLAVRRLARNPGFTAASLLTLALAIGVNTTTFTIVDAIVLKRTPFVGRGTLVSVFGTSPQAQSWPLSPANFQDVRRQGTEFETLAAYTFTTPSLGEKGQPAERLAGMSVTGDFLPMLGVAPALGRYFTAEESQLGHADVAIVANSFWRGRLAGDPNVIGRVLRLEGKPVTIVGVMPPSYDDPLLWGRTVLWQPMAFDAKTWQIRNSAWLLAMGRLRPGVTVPQAQAQLDGVAARLARDYPVDNTQGGLRVLTDREARLDPTGRMMSWLTMDLTLFVLLIACVNLANLQLARGSTQSREHAIRLALGSSRARLVGQLLTESLVLSLVGGALGLLVAQWGNTVIGRHIAINQVEGLDLPLNFRIVAFTFAASALTGAFFGIVPAWIASGTDANAALKQGGRTVAGARSQHRLRQALIVGELALALALLAAAGFFVQGTQRVVHLDFGWRPDNQLNGTLSLPYTSRYATDEQCRAFARRLQQDLAALPGVDHAVLSANPLTWGFTGISDFAVEGRTPPLRVNEEMKYLDRVTPGFFSAMGMHLVQGRDFSAADGPGTPPVIIVNAAMAQRFWPGENPLGRRIGSTDAAHPGWRRVIGVVNDIRNPGDLVKPASRFQTYEPLEQAPMHWLTFTLHSGADPHALEAAARRVVARLDPDLAVFRMETAEEDIQVITHNYALVGWVLTEMAALGLFLSAVGIYGVISNLAIQRTQEIGIRMALGAQAADVRWLVLRNGVILAAAGTMAGLVLALLLTHVLGVVTPEVPGQSLPALAGVAALLALVAILASWLPARRATRVDPIVALRGD